MLSAAASSAAVGTMANWPCNLQLLQVVDKVYVPAFAGKLFRKILSIVVFNLEQNFNQNITLF